MDGKTLFVSLLLSSLGYAHSLVLRLVQPLRVRDGRTEEVAGVRGETSRSWLSLRPSVVCHPPFVLRVRPLLVTLVASRCAGVYEERREERANMETDVGPVFMSVSLS